MKSPEQFDPRDPKYKKVADLPENKQGNFSDVEGGFITKEAVKYDAEAEKVAKKHNKWNLAGGSRTASEILKGSNRLSKEDVIIRNAHFLERERNNKTRNDIEWKNYQAARWNAFNKSDAVIISRLPNGSIEIGDMLVRDEEKKEFQISLKDLEEKGLIRAAQLADLYNIEVGLDDSGVFFSEELKDGWEKGLEKILGKKVQIEISEPKKEDFESTYLGTNPKSGNAVFTFGPKNK